MRVALLNRRYEATRRMDAAPICKVDFCDSCGDCLRCFGDDPCREGIHLWCVYEQDVTSWLGAHPDARDVN